MQSTNRPETKLLLKKINKFSSDLILLTMDFSIIIKNLDLISTKALTIKKEFNDRLNKRGKIV
jgi:hypothetical protein